MSCTDLRAPDRGCRPQLHPSATQTQPAALRLPQRNRLTSHRAAGAQPRPGQLPGSNRGAMLISSAAATATDVELWVQESKSVRLEALEVGLRKLRSLPLRTPSGTLPRLAETGSYRDFLISRITACSLGTLPESHTTAATIP